MALAATHFVFRGITNLAAVTAGTWIAYDWRMPPSAASCAATLGCRRVTIESGRLTPRTPPIMRYDEEAAENAEGERRHGEEVHRGNRFTMVVQTGRPSPCRPVTPGSLPHPAQHRPFRNLEAQRPRLSVDARRAPGGSDAVSTVPSKCESALWRSERRPARIGSSSRVA